MWEKEYTNVDIYENRDHIKNKLAVFKELPQKILQKWWFHPLKQ